jgi:hypothetical protein
MKHIKIPIISISDGFHDIEDLQIGKKNITLNTAEIRELYAKRAIILFILSEQRKIFYIVMKHFGLNS